MKPNASLNVKFDPQTTKLTWDCKENSSSGECVLIHKEKGVIKKKVRWFGHEFEQTPGDGAGQGKPGVAAVHGVTVGHD